MTTPLNWSSMPSPTTTPIRNINGHIPTALRNLPVGSGKQGYTQLASTETSGNKYASNWQESTPPAVAEAAGAWLGREKTSAQFLVWPLVESRPWRVGLIDARPFGSDWLITWFSASPPLGLTRRQLQVLTLVSYGLPNVQIAHHLDLSPRTVSTHVERVLARLGAPNRTAATRLILVRGWFLYEPSFTLQSTDEM